MWFFLIYMEALLQYIVPTATQHNITIVMFADNLTVWSTGRNIKHKNDQADY